MQVNVTHRSAAVRRGQAKASVSAYLSGSLFLNIQYTSVKGAERAEEAHF